MEGEGGARSDAEVGEGEGLVGAEEAEAEAGGGGDEALEGGGDAGLLVDRLLEAPEGGGARVQVDAQRLAVGGKDEHHRWSRRGFPSEACSAKSDK